MNVYKFPIITISNDRYLLQIEEEEVILLFFGGGGIYML